MCLCWLPLCWVSLCWVPFCWNWQRQIFNLEIQKLFRPHLNFLGAFTRTPKKVRFRTKRVEFRQSTAFTSLPGGHGRVMSELVKFLSLSNPLARWSDHFPDWLCHPGGINKNPSVWLDGVRPSPKYVFKNNISSKNSKIWPTGTLRWETVTSLPLQPLAY